MPILSVTEPEGGEAESNKSKYSTVQYSTFFGRHSPFIGHCTVKLKDACVTIPVQAA